MNKRVAIIALVIGFLMLMQPTQAFAAEAFTTVTCANPEGNQVTRQIGWDNSNVYFSGKGDIPRLYCEGGHAGSYTTYISDTLPADSPLRYYAGIIPTPTPTPETTTPLEPTPLPSIEPSPTISPEESLTPTPTPEVTIEPSLEPTQTPEPLATPTPEPTTTPTPEPKPTAVVEPSPTPEPEPTQTPSPEPTPETVEPTPVSSLPPIEPSATPTLEPTLEPTPEPSEVAPVPEPSLSPQVQTIELPENLQVIGVIQLAAAAEAIMNVGADMTPEEREESQIIAVAAIIVSQIAGSIRRITK
jgi:hypothetical protein